MHGGSFGGVEERVGEEEEYGEDTGGTPVPPVVGFGGDQRLAAFSICLMRIRFLSLDIWVILSRMRMPSRWSISCCQHLARSPEAVSEISLPSRSVAVMVTMDGRLTSPVIPGSERQPSS